MDPDADDDMEPKEAMQACEKRVAELVARGVTATAAWDEISRSPVFKAAKRLVVSKVAI